MIKLIFAIGGALRKVFINNRKVSLLSAETNFVPVEIDLDKIDNNLKKKISDEEKILLKEVALLRTEEDMANDIKIDFQKKGWRLIKRG